MRLLLVIIKTFLASKVPITFIAQVSCICNSTWWTLIVIAAMLVAQVCYITTAAFITSLAHVPFSECFRKILYHIMFFLHQIGD
jgi:hypothetical protein